MNPEITAIIPTHDRTRLLTTTLRTVLWQQSVELEVLVVDDGSSEDVAQVVAEVRDARVRLIRHERPLGVCLARNRGVSEARGAWLAFCDDDDLWAPNKLASQLSAAHDASRAWAYAGAVHVSGGLHVLSVKLPPSPETLVKTLPRWNIMPGGSSNVIVRADALSAVGGWDPGLINLADWDLWVRLARLGPPVCVAAPLVGYRIHSGNASADTELVLREAGLINGRYGAPLDYGELYHYLAWVHLRVGRRRPALPHLARATLRGQALAVGRTLVGLAAHQVTKRVPVLQPREVPACSAWRAETEAWIALLRNGSAATA